MIKNFLIKHFNKIWIEYKILKSKYKLNNVKKEDKKIFIFLAADYRNMGDVAITYAQKKFLEDTFVGYKVIEVPADKTLDYIKPIKAIINKDDIVTTIGGGNMGDIYEYYELLRRLVINKFKNNFVISFPQTIDFSETKFGQKSLKKTKKVIKNHKKVLILARENKSYKIMREYFGDEKVILTPDIVLYLKDKIEIVYNKKDKIGICFRDDKEIDINSKDIIEKIKEKFDSNNKFEFDTCINENVFKYDERYTILNDLLKSISSCEVIYTNRLHAMIFSYLVNTKCFFIDNSNKKLSETYKQWLSKCPNIDLATNDNIDRINENIIDDTSKELINNEFINLKTKIMVLYKKYIN